jgi:hypothetical protein
VIQGREALFFFRAVTEIEAVVMVKRGKFQKEKVFVFTGADSPYLKKCDGNPRHAKPSSAGDCRMQPDPLKRKVFETKG